MTEYDNTSLKEHISGVIVKHNHPFEHLPVFANDDELSLSMLKKFVAPFYFGISDIAYMVSKFNSIKNDLNFNIVKQLLGDTNWRSRSAASYFCAFQDLDEFEENIGNLLLKSEVCYAGRSYCIALANSAVRSDLAINYLQRYLDYYLYKPDLFFEQGIALAALTFIGKNKGLNLTSIYIDAWQLFTKNKPNCLLDDYVTDFAHHMSNLEKIKSMVVS